VLFIHVARIVTGKTAIAEQATRVTGITGAWAISAVAERESMRTVVRRWLPSGRIMARGTVETKQTGVQRRLAMASSAVARCSLKDSP
jgi:hypothetical protein